MACHERAQRVEWRRRELNPRPEITLAPASTCLVDDLISCPPPNVDILRRTPDVFISPLEQRPTQATSLLFSADLTQASDRAETTYLIRQPLRTPGRRNRRGRSHHCYWQLMFAHIFNQAKRASWTCHPHRCHPVETSRPRMNVQWLNCQRYYVRKDISV